MTDRSAALARSAAVLIGTSRYTHLPNVPAAANSLERMHGLLTGAACGWPPERVTVVADPSHPGGLPDRLVEIFAQTADVALFYYVGHGQPDHLDRLCLGLVESRRESERRYTTSLAFDAVRNAFTASTARIKIVILDCCFAGLATVGDGALGEPDLFTISGGTGAYTVAASGPYTSAWYEAEPGNQKPYTYFTKRLAEIVEQGPRDGSGVLTLGQLVEQLTEDLAAAGKPTPTSRVRDLAGRFPFARHGDRATPPSDTAAARDTSGAAAFADVSEPARPRPAAAVPGPGDSYADVPVGVWAVADPGERTLALERTGRELAGVDRPQARRVFAAAEQTARTIPADYHRALILEGAGRELRRAAPEQAARFFALAEASIDAIDDPQVRARALGNLGRTRGALP